jgi:hypothetical protein
MFAAGVLFNVESGYQMTIGLLDYYHVQFILVVGCGPWKLTARRRHLPGSLVLASFQPQLEERMTQRRPDILPVPAKGIQTSLARSSMHMDSSIDKLSAWLLPKIPMWQSALTGFIGCHLLPDGISAASTT